MEVVVSGSSTTTLPLPSAASGLSVAMVAKSLVNDVALTATVLDGEVPAVDGLVAAAAARGEQPQTTQDGNGHETRALSARWFMSAPLETE